MVLLLTGIRPFLPFHPPILADSYPIAAPDAIRWERGTYVLDSRSGTGSRWPRIDERGWDDALGRILADGAFNATIVIIPDDGSRARTRHLVTRLQRELPLARVVVLLGGEAGIPAGFLWRDPTGGMTE